METAWLKTESGVLAEAGKARFRPNIFLQVLIFIATVAVFLIGNQLLWETVFPRCEGQLFHLYILLPVIVLYMLYVRLVEGRSLYSMGFTSSGVAGRYLAGLVAGAGMMAAIVLLSAAAGGLKFDGISMTGTGLTLLLFAGGWIVQGMSEEVMFRGYFMVSAAGRAPLAVAVGLSAVLFSALHFIGRFIPLAFVNLTLYGIFAGLYFLRTDSIWGIAALHSAWNFTQCNIFGLKTSGMRSEAAVMSFSYGDNHLLNGGGFGPEGGLAATVVLLAGIAVLLFWPRKEKIKLKDNGKDYISRR